MPTELQEALTSLGASALVEKVIDPNLVELVRRYSPLMAAIPTKPWDSNIYYFNSRSALPQGGSVAEGGARPVSQSTYTQNQFPIKLFQATGQVTGFAQQVTRSLIGDLLRKEVQGATKGLTFDIETALVWGNASATANSWPQPDGLDVQFANFSGSLQNAIDAGGNPVATGYLDQLIEIVESNAAEPVDGVGTDYMFVASSRAISSFGQGLVSQQRYDTVEIAPGVIVPTWRGIPLVKSSFLAARSASVGAVTTSTATTGGSLAAGTYYYRMSAIMGRYGELNASAEVSQVTTGSASTVTLSFTPPASVQGSSVITYRVYRSDATGTETLLGVVDGVVGFQADGITPIPTTSIVDTGSALIPQNGATQPAIVPTAYYGTNSGLLPRADATTGNGGGEDIYLISRNEDNICRPYVRDIMPIPVAATVLAPDVLPFAMVTDTTLAVRTPEFGARVRNVVANLSNTNPVLLMHSV